MAEGISRRTIYSILKQFEENGHYERAKGSGRTAKIMTKKAISVMVNRMTKSTWSTRRMASKLSCSQSLVVKTLQRHTNIVARKKQKSPRYSKAAVKEIKRRARKLYSVSKGKTFVIDDEKYFGLSGRSMPGNSYYYADKKGKIIDCSKVKVGENLNQNFYC